MFMVCRCRDSAGRFFCPGTLFRLQIYVILTEKLPVFLFLRARRHQISVSRGFLEASAQVLLSVGAAGTEASEHAPAGPRFLRG